MIYKEKYRIGIEDVAHNSQATNKALLSIMEDIACAHSADVGYGVLEVETKHRAWVLLDWKIKVIKRPVYGCIIDASTWSRKIDRLCAYRDFELKDEDGEILAIGSSRWILTDTERRRPVRLTEDIAALYESEDLCDTEGNCYTDDYQDEALLHPENYLEKCMELAPEELSYLLYYFDGKRGCDDFAVEDGRYFRMLTQSERVSDEYKAYLIPEIIRFYQKKGEMLVIEPLPSA